MKFQKIVVFCFVLMSLVTAAQTAVYQPEREKIHDLM
ncbi:MAG: hypothetical protein ACJAVD_001245, partial [Porticoccaceae bacterium]